MLDGLIKKMKNYFNNFSGESKDMNDIINNLIDEKNNIITNEKKIYNNNIIKLKQDFEKSKIQAKIEYDKKIEDINKKFSFNKNNINYVNYVNLAILKKMTL